MLLLFAHGAGVPSSSPWMQGWAARLGTLGTVVTFDYPYMAAGRKAPDKLPTLLEAHREALRRARPGHDRVVLVGKSMGSRVGCHLSLEEPVDALVCLGYPLAGGQRLKDEVLVALRTPILFVQGTRDPLCPLDDLAEVRARMTAKNELFTVDGGDHSLMLPISRTEEQEASDASALAAIAGFVGG
jgi:predicted alpha/beta-hydrolase family hydrolase